MRPGSRPSRLQGLAVDFRGLSESVKARQCLAAGQIVILETTLPRAQARTHTRTEANPAGPAAALGSTQLESPAHRAVAAPRRGHVRAGGGRPPPLPPPPRPATGAGGPSGARTWLGGARPGRRAAGPLRGRGWGGTRGVGGDAVGTARAQGRSRPRRPRPGPSLLRPLLGRGRDARGGARRRKLAGRGPGPAQTRRSGTPGAASPFPRCAGPGRSPGPRPHIASCSPRAAARPPGPRRQPRTPGPAAPPSTPPASPAGRALMS